MCITAAKHNQKIIFLKGKMNLQEKAKRANDVFRDTKNGFISCEYRSENESIVYSFFDIISAHKFFEEQQVNFEGNESISHC